MNIFDKRKMLKVHPTRKYSKRDVNKITSIAIHHSLTMEGSAEAFARYHVSHNGWPGIGYHYVINKNGIIDFCNGVELKTAHVGNSNRYAIGICLIGDFRKEDPTEEQLNAAAKLCIKLIDTYESIQGVEPHSDYPGYEKKECPAFDIMKITNRMEAIDY